ncbi:hypothetical protein K469DRAFT_698931 [Zopfia rhizophila CBS 207.26]|uniref:Uncharacterized protein n=1 Tax=Zopfia rhizophila CBS 207.26 TaxID=1314779 RepID=A0A6A6EX36_9PEZI|nr:hypothetical protein K469DRAFT_698931 [Zopfia rhizophila CBS 207.26]
MVSTATSLFLSLVSLVFCLASASRLLDMSLFEVFIVFLLMIPMRRVYQCYGVVP